MKNLQVNESAVQLTKLGYKKLVDWIKSTFG